MTGADRMRVSPAADVFTGICRSVEAFCADTALPCWPATPCEAGAPGSWEELRRHAGDSAPGGPERIAAWHHVAHHLREESATGDERIWTLTAVGLLAPRLRGAAYAIARRTGAERADVGSALLLGVLEGARTLPERSADVERHLMDAAFASGWRTGRRGCREVPVAEWGEERDGAVPLSAVRTPAGVVSAGAMSGRLLQRVQGERLGALAHRLGLLPHVRQVRRTARSRSRGPSGGLHGGDHRARGEQPALFQMPETGGAAHAGPS
ncbi:hypothetical protein ACFVUH_18710 [Kitasatospora sp. NPDC058032]|uniref:hypothetical protein n=1 Tax=Kitasatospora sp. NPDC058032 TaxID=3346307 RepID=UPI0036DC8B59